MEDTFTLVLTRDIAWILQQSIHPDMPLGAHGMGHPAGQWQETALDLRRKVNNALLRFEDEPETPVVEIGVDEGAAWIIDRNVPFDGKGGAGTDVLLQCFRGLWQLDFQGLPDHFIAEQPVPSQEEVNRLLHPDPDPPLALA